MSNVIQTDFVQQHAEVATAVTLLDKWIATRARDIIQPGLAVGIVHKGVLIWAKGFGYANLESKTPATPDTLYRVASISKTFTGTAILQLCDAGKLRLDDPITMYLPWFELQYPDAPPITIRHALTHTSGLPRDATVPQWTDNTFQPWEEIVDTTQRREPVMPPVMEFKYSNLGYTLLGGVIESVSGQSYADYVQANILDPLDMHATFVELTGDEANLATGYLRPDENYVRKPGPFVDAKGMASATGFASTVNDLAKYARFHLSTEDNGVLSPHTLRDMHRVHWLNEDWKTGYGLGTMVQRIDDWTISGHGGGYKGYLTMFTVCRQHNFGAIVLTNTMNPPLQYVEMVYKLVLPAVIEATEERPEPDPEWKPYVGTYADDAWTEVEVVIRKGQLQIVSMRFIDDPPVVLLPTDEPHVFKIKVPGGGGETARFEFDTSGEITRLWVNNEYSRRIK